MTGPGQDTITVSSGMLWLKGTDTNGQAIILNADHISHIQNNKAVTKTGIIFNLNDGEAERLQ